MDIRFLRETNQTHLCSVQLSISDREKLKEAVREQYWVQLFVDDLLVWGRLGKDKEVVYTHIHLQIHYNRNHIVQVLYQPGNPVKLASADEVQQQSLHFTYSAVWLPTSSPFETRLYLYQDPGFVDVAKQWLSGSLSVLTVVLGCAVIIIIRIEAFPNDTVKEMNIQAVHDFAGWKQIAGEVFRAPSCLLMFTVCVSVGVQLLAVAACMQLLCFLYPMYTERNYMTEMAIKLYSGFALLGGLCNGSFYKQHHGRYWISAMLASLLGLPSIIGMTMLYLPAVFPLIDLEVGFLLVAAPLHVAGTMIGRKYLADPKFPCKVNLVRKPIRSRKNWLERPLILNLMGGIFPFCCLLLTTSSIFSCFWNYKLLYTSVYGLVIFLALLGNVMSMAIWMTLIMLGIEEPRWPWLSFLCGGSTAGFLFLVASFHYVFKPQVSGALVYFGYMGLVCLGLFLLCGAVAYFTAYRFVRFTYSSTKSI